MDLHTDRDGLYPPSLGLPAQDPTTLKRAWSMAVRGQGVASVALLEQELRSPRDHEHASALRIALADIHIHMRDPQRALHVLQGVFQTPSLHGQGHLCATHAHLLLGDHNAAHSALDKARACGANAGRIATLRAALPQHAPKPAQLHFAEDENTLVFSQEAIEDALTKKRSPQTPQTHGINPGFLDDSETVVQDIPDLPALQSPASLYGDLPSTDVFSFLPSTPPSTAQAPPYAETYPQAETYPRASSSHNPPPQNVSPPRVVIPSRSSAAQRVQVPQPPPPTASAPQVRVPQSQPVPTLHRPSHHSAPVPIEHRVEENRTTLWIVLGIAVVVLLSSVVCALLLFIL